MLMQQRGGCFKQKCSLVTQYVHRTVAVLHDPKTATWSTLAACEAPAAVRDVEAQVAGQPHVRRPADGNAVV